MRTTRNQTEFTKKRISDAMKVKHQQRTETEKKHISQKQSEAMKAYWQKIPTVEECVNLNISKHQKLFQEAGITDIKDQEAVYKFLTELAQICLQIQNK